ncbi:hypothetical protein SCUP234_12048 [Seiridium cupressi]
MRVSKALCALSISSWTLAAPIVMVFKHAPPKYSGPSISSKDTWPVRTPKFRIAEEADAQDALEARPDNRPFTPSSDVTPSEALAAPRPLKTSYLLSIKPFMVHEDEKTSVPLAEFQESSTVKEETGVVMRHDPTIVELETEGNKPFYRKTPCPTHAGHFHLDRRYADRTVVGIVFILIAAIALIELWGPICRTTNRIWYGEGRIRLEDDPNEKEQLKQRYADFVLQPAPETRSRSNTLSEKADPDS